MKSLELGQRVRIKSLDAKGKIFHIDQKNYFQHHMLPIQIVLDKPLTDDSYQMKGATWYRTGVDDIVPLKKKVSEPSIQPKKKKKKKAEPDAFLDFSF